MTKWEGNDNDGEWIRRRKLSFLTKPLRGRRDA